jgi:hypothetical protein
MLVVHVPVLELLRVAAQLVTSTEKCSSFPARE